MLQTSFGSAARKEARMSITGVRDVDEVPAEATHGSDLPPNMSMSTVLHVSNNTDLYSQQLETT